MILKSKLEKSFNLLLSFNSSNHNQEQIHQSIAKSHLSFSKTSEGVSFRDTHLQIHGWGYCIRGKILNFLKTTDLDYILLHHSGPKTANALYVEQKIRSKA